MAKVIPSILSADFLCLQEQIYQLIEEGIDALHIDVMDGHFVPNLTIGPMIVNSISPISREHNILLDVHLMVTNPDELIEPFAEAGANIITVHAEATRHLNRTIKRIQDFGCKAGVAINPATPLSHYDYILEFIDLALIMTVNPGFGGQTFIENSYNKISQMREMIDAVNQHCILEVDGGIKASNVYHVTHYGADWLVIGSGIFNKVGTIRENIREIYRAMNK